MNGELLDLGCECHAAARCAPDVKWFDAKPVACGKKTPLGAVENYEREHSVEVGEASLSPLVPCRQNNFCIGAGVKRVTTWFKLPTQFGEIVDLPVERQPAL